MLSAAMGSLRQCQKFEKNFYSRSCTCSFENDIENTQFFKITGLKDALKLQIVFQSLHGFKVPSQSQCTLVVQLLAEELQTAAAPQYTLI